MHAIEMKKAKQELNEFFLTFMYKRN